MKPSRRDFLKATGVFVGVTSLPGWVLDAEAAEAAAVDKNALADIAISRAKKLGATYADIRINRYRNESIFTREQQVQNVSRSQNFGFGVRVLVKGAWGFAASYVVTPESVKRITEKAVEVATANAAYQRKPIHLLSTPKVVTSWKSSFQKDPFDIPADVKIAFLLNLNETAMKTKGTSFVTSGLSFQNEQKFYAST